MRKQRSVQYNLQQNSLNREYMAQQRTTQGPDTRKWWGDQNSLNREYPSKQRTTRGPDTRKRKGDQHNPHQSSLGRECLSEQRTTQCPITRKRSGNQYCPDREGVSSVRSPERARERRQGSHRRGHEFSTYRDSLNRGGSLKMSPKIIKQENGPSGSDHDSSDQDLEYMSKNWTKTPGTRRRDKVRDSLDRVHLSKDQPKLNQQDRACSDDQRNLHRSDPNNDWGTFLKKYTLFARNQGWNDKMSDNLCWCLEGKASDFYMMYADNKKTTPFKYWVSEFERRFGFNELPETALINFSNAYQNPGELLEDWADRVLKLASSSFCMLSAEDQTQRAIYRFCVGGADREASLRVVNQRLTSLEEAVGQVRLAILNRQMIYGRSKRGGPEYPEG